jgi:formylglycine-generating enzyme required for sulfatase activity
LQKLYVARMSCFLDGQKRYFAVLLLIGVIVLAATADADDAVEMRRIPAGPFLMGRNDGPTDERPQHQINLPEFFIDRLPVTNSQFARFLAAKGSQGPAGERWYDIDDDDARIHVRNRKWQADPGFENHPVVEASWLGAVAYCESSGKRLPTEAEWEKSARGTDGRKFPWGNDRADHSRAHFKAAWNDFRPVGSFPKGASPYGVFDLAGNGWEWVSSAYLPYPYDPADGREDLKREFIRVTRGGGQDSAAEELTTTHRGGHVSRNFRSGHHNIGFRCAR